MSPVTRGWQRELDHGTGDPALCKHPRRHIADWKTSDSDSVIYTYKCRDCSKYFEDEVVGSQVRAEEAE